MKQVLKVDSEKEYLIEISDNDFDQLHQDIDDFTQGQKRLFIISQKVYKLYGAKFNFDINEIFILKDGEKQKNYKNYIKILKHVIKLGLNRTDVIIAIGGGVVGDIAGFVASTYMRGIDFIQVPTTLLAAVDSSVGGKTAIDFKNAKNVVGSFYQPKKVFINTNFMNTLDKRQYLSGIGEILKYAFIEKSCNYEKDLYLFEFLMLSCEKLLKKEPITMIRVIEYCLRLKIAVVNQDEKEKGLRKILNLGHTYAHALETITKYKKFTHGEAVVYGLFFIFDWAYKYNYITYSNYRLSKELMEKFGYKPLTKRYNKEKMLELMSRDKKATTNKLTFIIPIEKKQVKEIQLIPAEVEYMLEK